MPPVLLNSTRFAATGGYTPAVTFASAGTLTERTAETSTPVPYPATVALGDVLVLLFSTRATGVNITTPTNWTLVAQLSPNAGVANGDLGVWIKFATAADVTLAGSAGTLAVAHTSQASISQMLAFTGADLVTPQDATATTVDQAASTSCVIPGVTIATVGAALVAASAQNSTNSDATPPTSPGTFTETGDRGTGGTSAEWSYLTGLASGPTSNVTVNWSQSVRSVGILLALKPAAAAISTWAQTVLGLGNLVFWSRLANAASPFSDTVGGHSVTWGAGVTGGVTGPVSDGAKAITAGSAASTLATATWMDGTNVIFAACWIKTTGTGTERHAFSRYTNNTNFAWSLGVSSTNKAIFRVKPASSATSATGTTTVTDGNWHFICGVWDRGSTTAKLYVDGVLEATSSAATGALTTGNPLSIGSGYATSTWTAGDGIAEAIFCASNTTANVPDGTSVAALWAAR